MAKKILIVDDTLTVRMFEKMILGQEGFELIEAINGARALETARQNRPDLILLDVMMPEMDGIECLQHLKSDEATKTIPVIMLTTLGEKHQIERGIAAGCDDYMTKPIRKIELLSKIKRLLEKGGAA